MANDPDNLIPRVTKNSWSSWVTGVNITVVAVGDRPVVEAGAKRPAVKDLAAGQTVDNQKRTLLGNDIGFVNFTQVKP
jgi:hypothetical protein